MVHLASTTEVAKDKITTRTDKLKDWYKSGHDRTCIAALNH